MIKKIKLYLKYNYKKKLIIQGDPVPLSFANC